MISSMTEFFLIFLLVCHLSLQATKNVWTNWAFIFVDVVSLCIFACLQQTKSSKFMQRVASGAFQLYTFVPVQWRELCEAFGPGKVNESSLRQLVSPCKDQLLVDGASSNHKCCGPCARLLRSNASDWLSIDK